MKMPVAVATAVGLTMASFVSAAPDGVALFKKSCAPCHAADGSGNTPVGKTLKARDLRSAEVAKLTDEQLAAIVKNGKGKMPGFSSMSREDIESLVSFIRALQRKE